MSSFYEHDEIHRGLALKRAGRSTEAEGIFKAILAKNPKNEWARVELASFLTDFHAQETLLQEGIKAGYPSANLKVALSQLFSQQGNFEQAAYYAKQAVKEAPKNSATHVQLIRLQRGAQDLEILVNNALTERKDPEFVSLVLRQAMLSYGLEYADNVVPTAPTLSVGRPIMNAVQVSMVKDEDDIIYEQLKNHYDLGFRNFAIADNASTDRTAERIHKFRAEYPDARVLYVFDPVVGYTQAIKTTALARYAADFFRSDGLDIKWVFPLDADEFISMPAEGNDLLSLLEHLEQRDEKMIAYFACHLSLPHVVDSIEDGVSVPGSFSNITHYRHRPVFKVAYKFGPTAELEMGNHFCRNVVDANSQIFHASSLGIYLCHLPYRSLKQVKSKILNGGSALAAAPGVVGGGHWRTHYERYKAEGDAYIHHVLSDYVKNIAARQ